ncbi:NAD(P)-binding protein [Hymenobacter taeanensis]|uniref:NAD(P)-binding protein n=1 Tax=Hymenobacter taeanensis TaxID=2735321 RepID=A0A6M6BI04_9BACT|nr:MULTISPECIES: FAD-dependent oxidoreductase [Hymenobacter]QJX47726.1 NAD(P)-binding protein [Hymenobacter taeanensis]UOQ82789.1 FAD-dependent oxidoreductase [Hymenobacter sp. 5414T-23]
MANNLTSEPTSAAPVLVVGAGLAGLITARTLHKAGVPVQLLEARDRVGGRTLAVPALPGSPEEEWLDLGATWGWAHHPFLMRLFKELAIDPVEQPSTGATAYETTDTVHRLPHPSGSAGYLRLVGGAAILCRTLAAGLPAGAVQLNTRVTQLRHLANGSGVELQAVQGRSAQTYFARAVVLALPPRLVAHSIAFVPALAAPLQQALRSVPTWMSHAMKSIVVYAEPFWRQQGWSGFGVSQLGPLSEIHDASPLVGNTGALFGFFGAPHPLRTASVTDRQAAVVRQLVRMFGPQAGAPLAYHELDWSLDPLTSVPGDEQPPLAVPLQGPELLRQPAWAGTLHWAGAETSASEWGRLDGAVESGYYAAAQVLRQPASGA